MKLNPLYRVFYVVACLCLMVTPLLMYGAITGMDDPPWYVSVPGGLWAIVVLILSIMLDFQRDEVLSYWQRAYQLKADRLEEELSASDS